MSDDISPYPERKMLPNEIILLMAIVVNKNTGKHLLTHPMDITGKYIGYLYQSLVNRGYIRGRRLTGYHPTPAGREAILEFLKGRKTRAKDIAKRLQWLGIEVSPEQEQKIGRLENEATAPR
jgi:hypothetical protein